MIFLSFQSQKFVFWRLKDILSEMPYPDIAEFIMELDDELDEEKLAVKVFRILPKDISADVFAYLDPDSQMLIVRSITDSEIIKIRQLDYDFYFNKAKIEGLPCGEENIKILRRCLQSTISNIRDNSPIALSDLYSALALQTILTITVA